ncbi:McrB family protein [Paraburkholderia sp.]|uniref:McrB family protein n=1 Tax=Paraburkholderia sp. TaxID=1926495 RepID=UPI003C79DED4
MAKYSEYIEYETEPVYGAAERLLKLCLQGDGSLISDEVTLWTLDNLEKLHKLFVAAPDDSARSFTDKFRDQIEPAGEVICRLAAEVVGVYFFFPSSVGAPRKKELVGEVLGWVDQKLPTDSVVAKALSRGIGSGGQGYNTRRPAEIAFIIEFAIAWKRLEPSGRIAAARDPWRFMEVVDSVEGADARQVRHMLLHVLFPDTFERIASRDHKRRVVSAFAPLLDADVPEETDRCLLAIRKELETLLERQKLDFYRSPLVEVWNDSGVVEEGFATLDALRHKKQVVLYGPPGTGKTYRAKRVADRLIRAALLKKLGPKVYFDQANTGEVDSTIKSRIHRLQLHPAYSYEEFICGLHIDGKGGTEYRLGFLPRLVDSMNKEESDLPRVLILDEMNRADLSRMLGECFSLLEDRDEEIALPGRDSEGKPMTLRIPMNLFIIGTMNLIDQSVEQMDFALRRRFLWVMCPFDGEALVSAARQLWESDYCRVTWRRVEGDFVRLAGAASALNREIHNSSLLGAQYEIGHTYLLDVVAFLKDDLGPGTRLFLWAGDGGARRPVLQAWELSLKPLIVEYLSGLDARSRDAEVARLAAVFLRAPSEAN